MDATFDSRTAWKQLHDFQIGCVLRRPDDETTTRRMSDAERRGDGKKKMVNGKTQELLSDDEHHHQQQQQHPLHPRDDDATQTHAAAAAAERHPMPSWLSSDRDFWKRYSGGVTAQVLDYLSAQGYPQGGKKGADDDDDDDGVRGKENNEAGTSHVHPTCLQSRCLSNA